MRLFQRTVGHCMSLGKSKSTSLQAKLHIISSGSLIYENVRTAGLGVEAGLPAWKGLCVI